MKVKLLHPLISCICITAGRPKHLLKAIMLFEQQVYPNKQLIISYPLDDQSSAQIVSLWSERSCNSVMGIQRDQKLTIGAARNSAIQSCDGEYVCIWDDDDLYSSTRLSDQYNKMLGNGKHYQASMLNNITLYNTFTEQAVLSAEGIWSGSLLCKKSLFNIVPCQDSTKDELLPVINYIKERNQLMSKHLDPGLYTFTYHGANLMTGPDFDKHHQKGRNIDVNHLNKIRVFYNQELKIL